MEEGTYVLLAINDAEKRIEVVLQSFEFGSEEAEKAIQNEELLFDLACTHDYKVYCNGELVFDPAVYRKLVSEVDREKDKNNAYLEELYKKWDERDKRLAEIKQKDLLDLTEEEIVLLAESRVRGDQYKGIPTLRVPTTFEREYEEIKMAIEERKSRIRKIYF